MASPSSNSHKHIAQVMSADFDIEPMSLLENLYVGICSVMDSFKLLGISTEFRGVSTMAWLLCSTGQR